MFGAGRPKRRGGSIDQAWEQWAATINADNRGGQRPRRTPWQQILAGTLIGIAFVSAMRTARAARRRREESRGTGRVEFVDVDRPGSPISIAR
ncbi:MAG TPA: hypothetical protein VFX61_15180 [Micromonosporaceae bacterium]|nr:hypothetical protein [Micromonosporaceae bacterium]